MKIVCGLAMDNEDIKEKIKDLNRSIDFSLKKLDTKGETLIKGRNNILIINNVETFKIKKTIYSKFKNVINLMDNQCLKELDDKILESKKYDISNVKDINLKECLINIQDIVEKIKNRMS